MRSCQALSWTGSSQASCTIMHTITQSSTLSLRSCQALSWAGSSQASRTIIHTCIHTFLAQVTAAIVEREQSSKLHCSSHISKIHTSCVTGDGRDHGAGAVLQGCGGALREGMEAREPGLSAGVSRFSRVGCAGVNRACGAGSAVCAGVNNVVGHEFKARSE